MKYIVKGTDETVVNVDILGEIRIVGEKVELEEEVAAPFVEAGTLELSDDQSVVLEEGEVIETKGEDSEVAITEDEGVDNEATGEEVAEGEEGEVA